MFDLILKISSISGAFLIFCGVLKLILYYAAFHVRIISFLSFSEIITSFMDDINILLIYITLMAVSTAGIIKVLHIKTKLNIDFIISYLLNVAYHRRYKYILLFLLVILVLSVLLFLGIFKFNYYIIYIILFCTIQLLTFSLMTKKENGEIDVSIISLNITVVFTIILSIFLLAKHDIQVAYSYKQPVIVSTDKIKYVCNQETKNIFIGKTDNYVFIKLSMTNSTLVLPISEIKAIEIE
jgi:hypothetical protein